MTAEAIDHNCVCRDYPGPWRGCKCGVYTDANGNWCANENCRAQLGPRHRLGDYRNREAVIA